MTALYIFLLLVQLGILIFFIRRGRKKRSAVPEAPLSANSYERERDLALSITARELKLTIPDARMLVYGVIMDWNMEEAIVTLAAYITGAANMYFSTGEGIKGGGKSVAVGEAAVELIAAAQEYIERAIPVTTTELPNPACVRFYFLTNHRMYAAQEQVKHFEDATSPLLALFEKGNRVLTEMQANNKSNVVDIEYN
jgi:hypothetical protein